MFLLGSLSLVLLLVVLVVVELVVRGPLFPKESARSDDIFLVFLESSPGEEEEETSNFGLLSTSFTACSLEDWDAPEIAFVTSRMAAFVEVEEVGEPMCSSEPGSERRRNKLEGCMI